MENVRHIFETGTLLTETERERVSRNFLRKNGVEFTEENVRQFAPSVFAEKPMDGVSSRYKFYPTYKVMEKLEEDGWKIFDAHQMRARTGDNTVTKHVLRFRHPEFQLPTKVGDSVPEMVVINSHDKKTAFSVRFGMFRLVCSNGLIVQSRNLGSMKLRHAHPLDQVMEAVEILIKKAPAIGSTIGEMQMIDLDEYERQTFAKKALEIRYHGHVPDVSVPVEKLLEHHRTEDAGKDLWTTYNVVQENLTQGGLSYERPGKNGKQRQASLRGVKNVMDDLRLNVGLWEEAESYLTNHRNHGNMLQLV
jgi:Domain of unknown function (DUF932).